ncbi:MAG: tRNA (adenosine(37)-N6)-threonylcarbamoyltransferase complex ATPase subunit type 1 TsaE [Planctomycetales bacterium]|nr:tRNA (adenosine(37)-N6)-threonylcarbamoyltransferase complex ATPase subunit type 1 TsaE [Planctomycetales bacterium]
MGTVEFMARNEADTDRLGAILAQWLPDGATVCLSGTLGAGKTRLVQAVARACQVPLDQVVSPTFTLCNEYRGTRRIDHFDVYRVRDEDELLELGLDEYFDAPSLTFVEWGERYANQLPDARVDIQIELLEHDQRLFRIVDRIGLAELSDFNQSDRADLESDGSDGS